MRKPLIHLFIAVLLLFVPPGFAQSSQQAQPQPPPAATPAQPITVPAQPAAPSQTPASPQAQPTPSPNRLEIEPVEKEHQITPTEARELFRSVDEILRFASQDTGLPVRKKVKRTIVSRKQVEKYIGDKFKDDAD